MQLLKNYMKALPGFSIPGASCIVCKDHEVVFQQNAGYIDAKKEKPVSENSLFYMYSVSKPMTAVAAPAAPISFPIQRTGFPLPLPCK